MRYLGDEEWSHRENRRLGALYQAPDGTLYQVQGLAAEDEASDLGLGALYEAPDGTLYQVQGLAAEDEASDLGLGALYEAPDGTLYQVQGLAAEDEASDLGLGALYEAPDGSLYQVQGLAAEDDEGADAAESEEEDESPAAEAGMKARPRPALRRVLARRRAQRLRRPPPRGKPAPPAQAKVLRPVAARARPAPGRGARGLRPGGQRRRPPGRRGKGILGKLLRPVAKLAKAALPFVPGVGPIAAAGVSVAERALRKPGVAGAHGLGALYQAPDGSLYRVEGLSERDDELQGMAAEEDLDGLSDAEEQAMGEDLDGYVREDQGPQLAAYEPETPPRTPWFTPPGQPPRMWQPLW